MAGLALAMLGVMVVLTMFVRVGIQLRRTGKTGLIGLRRGAGPVEVLGGVLFISGMGMGALSAVLVLRDSLEIIDALESDAIQAVGVVLASIGGLAVFGAQLGMGESWRIGVDDEERLDLVTGGWSLMVPTWLAFAAIAVIGLGLEIQVRAVEEPYLVRTHGDEFRSYAARVGRFVPGLGRISR
jgi:protein-S-isoprenylcysteine O-methyltransferase Ste14